MLYSFRYITLFFLCFFNLLIAADKTWNGSADSDWNNSLNWTPVGVPTAADTAIFSDTPFPVDISSNPQINGLTLSDGSLSLTGGHFNFAGSSSNIYSEGTLDIAQLAFISSDYLNINVVNLAETVSMNGLDSSVADFNIVKIGDGYLDIGELSGSNITITHMEGILIVNPFCTGNFILDVRSVATVDSLSCGGVASFYVNGGTLTVGDNVLSSSSDEVYLSAGSKLILELPLTVNSNIIVNGDSTLEVWGDSTITNLFAGDPWITLTKTDYGTLTLEDSVSINHLDIHAGQVNGVANMFNGNITLGDDFDSANVLFKQDSAGSFDGNIIGNGTVIKTGAESLSLTGTTISSIKYSVQEGELIGDTNNIVGNVVIASGSSLTFNQSNDGAYENFISGDGSLYKIGSGSLSFSNAITYTGGTYITEGALKVDAITKLGSNIINIGGGILEVVDNSFDITNDIILDSGGGTFDIGRDVITTISGNISGSGGFIKEGLGSLYLSGSNSYTGNIQIDVGSVTGNSETLLGDITLNDGTSVLYDQTSDATYLGSISGLGTFIKDGEMSLTLSGTFVDTIDINVDDGTLVGTTSNLSGDILLSNGATVQYDQDFDGTYSGIISGVGIFKKEGSGKMVYDGVHFMPSNATINNGEFSIQKPINCDITIGIDAVLSGISTVTGNVICNGGVSPGNSPGTLEIIGDYIFGSDSTYYVEISPAQGDLIDITGSATILPGARVVIQPDFGIGSYDSSYTILQTTEGITGEFSSVYYPYPSFTGTVLSDGNNINFLLLEAVPFASLVTGDSNAHAVATYVDSISAGATGDLEYVINNLQFLQVPEMEEAFDQMHAAIYKGAIVAQEERSTRVNMLINNRSKSYCNQCCENHDNNKGISQWVTSYGDFVRQGSSEELSGFTSNTGGVLVGVDNHLTSNFSLGVTAGYNYSNIEYNNRGEGDINSFYGGLYASWCNNRFFVNASGGGFFNAYSGKRYIKFYMIDRVAKNHHNGGEFAAHIDGGIILRERKYGFEFTPILALDYMYIHESSFSETGANSLNLVVGSEDYNFWRSEIGLDIAKCFMYKNNSFRPNVALSLVREMRDHGRYYTGYFANEPGSFKVHGMLSDLKLISPKFALTYENCNNQLACSLGYKGEFGKHRQDNMVYLEIVLKF